MLYCIMVDGNQTGAPVSASTVYSPPAIVHEDRAFRQAQIELSKLITITERPARNLTLEDQEVFDRAFRRSARVRQVIEL